MNSDSQTCRIPSNDPIYAQQKTQGRREREEQKDHLKE